MFSLLLRNLFFTILQPGIVAGLIPYLILNYQKVSISFEQVNFRHYSGIAIFVIGFAIMIFCILSFAIKGKGTLSPLDPAKKLITAGLYRFSRNPMYVGVLLILTGEAVYFLSVYLFVYTLFAFAAFYGFVVFYEEPYLKKVFSEEYISYCSKVRRWI